MNLTFTTALASVLSLGCLQAQPVVYQGSAMNVMVPEQSLASGSLLVTPNTEIHDFTHWQNDQKLETYDLVRRIANVWEKKGIQDYLIFGKQTPQDSFHWEVIPFPKEGLRLWKQLSVLWKITFGSANLSEEQREEIAKNFRNENDLTPVNSIEFTEAVGHDAFCNQEVINRQLVFDGKEIRLLYNHAPIAPGEEKLHFLVIPKQHRVGFSDLTEAEYMEAMQLVQKLIDYYKNKEYPIAYIYDKTGAEAGQTVPHWHEHVVFAASEDEAFLAKLTVLKNRLFSGAILPRDELKAKVESLRKKLADAL